MPFDIVAWLETQTATALSGVAAVADDVYRYSGDDIYVKKRAPYLGGVLQVGVTTPKYMEFRQPSLKIPYRFFKAGLSTDADHVNAFTDLLQRPLPLYEGEKLNAYVQNASAEYSAIIAWLLSGRIPLASLAVNPTHSITGYLDSALTANVWNTLSMTWDQSLEKGRYAVVGMKAGSYLAAGATPLVARLKLLDSTFRPGVITSELGGDKTLLQNVKIDPTQVWPLMQEISFEHDELPSIEFLSLTADTDHVVELLLQKIS